MYARIDAPIYRAFRYFVFIVLFAHFAAACSAPRARIEPTEGKSRVAHGALLVDVRSPEEFASGHVEGARNIPQEQIERRLSEFGDDRSREIVVYCGSGRRAALAQETLSAHGFISVFNAGGYESWLGIKAPPQS